MTDITTAARPLSGIKDAGVSATALLKQAVSGSAAPGSTKSTSDAKPAGALRRRLLGAVDARAAIFGGAALSLGLVMGAGTVALLMSRGDMAASTLSQLRSDLDTGRAETTRISAEIGRLSGTIVKSNERMAEDAKATRSELTQRVTRMEQALATKLVAFAEKQDVADREQAARLSSLGTLIEMRTAPQTIVPPAPQAAKPVIPDPVQTGSIADTKAAVESKPKPVANSNWAVREVYDGIAVLEDRKRRLVEVARGDMIPGVGRAEAIERRGRAWVVVTKDGLITAQDW